MLSTNHDDGPRTLKLPRRQPVHELFDRRRSWQDVKEFILYAVLGTCVSVSSAVPVSMANPGAETVSPTDPEMPADISTYISPGGRALFDRDTTVHHSGTASFHIRNDGHPEQPESGHSALFEFTVETFPGLTYEVSAQVRTQAVREAGLLIRGAASAFDIPGQPRATISGSNDWTRVSVSVSPTEADTTFRVFMFVPGRGEVWFDDVEVHDNSEAIIGDLFSGLQTRLQTLRRQAAGLGEAFSADELRPIDDALDFAGRVVGRDVEVNRAELQARHDEVQMLIRDFGRELSVRRVVMAVRQRTGAAPGVVLGFAGPTERVFLRDHALPIRADESGRIMAVRGEREAVQLVILPLAKELTDVQVSIGDLRSGESLIPSSAVEIHPVGSVRITQPGANWFPAESAYVGWWPDPLLPNFPFDVARAEAQAVWLSVRIPRDAAPGTYRGRIAVVPGNAEALEAGLEVTVADVELPERWHFRNLLCFDDDGYGPMIYKDAWTDAMRRQFIDFLLDRRINIGGLSGQSQKRITLEETLEFAARGQNVIFAYQFWGEQRMHDVDGNPVTELPKSNNDTMPGPGPVKLRDWIPKLQAAGVGDRAIVYGWDERGPEFYPDIRVAAELLAREFPGLPLMMAGVDRSCGTESTLAGLDNIIYMPLMLHWDPVAARQAQANGNEVWWYTIHWNIEHHLIRSRLIPWQTHKVEAGGFLIWAMNRWTGERNKTPLSGDKIRTDWDPQGDGGGYINSTAMYVYPGVDGPISSLRLENFADGIEEYDLLQAAEAMVAALEQTGKDPELARLLRHAIAIDDSFVRNALEYSVDPVVLAAHRQRLIDALTVARRELKK
jgi:hypothetical protein